MTQIQFPQKHTQQQFDADDDSETIEVDMEEYFRNEEQYQKINATTDVSLSQLPSLTNVLGSSIEINSNHNTNLNNLNDSVDSETIFPRYPKDHYINQMKQSNQCPISLPKTSRNRRPSLRISSSVNSSEKDDYKDHIHQNYRDIRDFEEIGDQMEIDFYPSEVKTRSMKRRQLSQRSIPSLSERIDMPHHHLNDTNQMKQFNDYFNDRKEMKEIQETSKDSEEKKPIKQFKTEPRRLTYLREKKIFGRNEESEIINGLQFILVNNHGASFDYVKEKRSKKTIKFRMPYSMTFESNTFSSTLLAEMGEQWLIDRGLCMKCNEKVLTAKRIQRSKEAEVNGGLICLLHSLGYDFDFKKLKDKLDRKTTPFVKISHFKYPNDKEWRNVEELKKLGRKYNDVMLMQEDQLANLN